MTTETSQVDMGHWIWRIVAYIIDSIIIAIPTYIIWFIITLAVIFTSGSFIALYGFSLLFPFIFGILEVLYFAVLDSAWGATIGKRILGLQVQTVKGGGKPAIGQAFIRDISKIYWIFVLIDWIIGLVTPGPDRRQKYTDRIAGTTVVQVRQAFQSVSPPPSSPSPPSTS
jgi:uncharacterized RDD family membrane protein YckC